MNELVKEKSWFNRNWKWFVPVSGCLLIIILFIFGIGAAIFGISKVLTNSEPYEYAIEQANKNQHLIDQIGEPIESNGMMNGNISLKNKQGNANFTIPIKGSKGKGTLHVIAEKFDGDWVYEDLYVTINQTNDKVNLLDKSSEDF
ncbi:cytochrome c oxidase assembly factor Coa1 family protein [Urechidicola croceus]|uniref:Cytochrome oxidase complex assembly protein 1 n=1 Tax=Urechidicola croceus TaxID=1850246 RepID=A0A1D8P8M5_9FLAO|nr:cytochrome c oxidase assembly factor Coa1 family protein [Urechidicola croceus]AOW20923.1 hypothetical protein LPB138_09670 [Urechidicola croceus]